MQCSSAGLVRAMGIHSVKFGCCSSHLVGCFWEENLSAPLYRVLRGYHAVAYSPGVGVDLKVVPALERKGREGLMQEASGGGCWGWAPTLPATELPLVLLPGNPSCQTCCVTQRCPAPSKPWLRRLVLLSWVLALTTGVQAEGRRARPNSQDWSRFQRSGWCRSCPGPGCPGSSACPSPLGRHQS